MLVSDNTSIRCERGVRGRQVRGHRGHDGVCVCVLVEWQVRCVYLLSVIRPLGRMQPLQTESAVSSPLATPT